MGRANATKDLKKNWNRRGLETVHAIDGKEELRQVEPNSDINCDVRRS